MWTMINGKLAEDGTHNMAVITDRLFITHYSR